jgi:hypothetical protein
MSSFQKLFAKTIGPAKSANPLFDAISIVTAANPKRKRNNFEIRIFLNSYFYKKTSSEAAARQTSPPGTTLPSGNTLPSGSNFNVQKAYQINRNSIKIKVKTFFRFYFTDFYGKTSLEAAAADPELGLSLEDDQKTYQICPRAPLCPWALILTSKKRIKSIVARSKQKLKRFPDFTFQISTEQLLMKQQLIQNLASASRTSKKHIKLPT